MAEGKFGLDPALQNQWKSRFGSPSKGLAERGRNPDMKQTAGHFHKNNESPSALAGSVG
jgi:hypothetical protein